MEPFHPDLRVTRTRQAIRTAFLGLLEEKGFEAITVKDITARALINRATFYAHYDDKYALMNAIEEQLIEDLLAIRAKQMPALVQLINEGKETMETSPIAIATLKYISENRTLLNAMLGPHGNIAFQHRLKDFIWKSTFTNSAAPFIKEEKLRVPSQYLASYLTSAHIGVIQQWLQDGLKETPEQMASILSTMTINGILYAAGLKEQ